MIEITLSRALKLAEKLKQDINSHQYAASEAFSPVSCLTRQDVESLGQNLSDAKGILATLNALNEAHVQIRQKIAVTNASAGVFEILAEQQSLGTQIKTLENLLQGLNKPGLTKESFAAYYEQQASLAAPQFVAKTVKVVDAETREAIQAKIAGLNKRLTTLGNKLADINGQQRIKLDFPQDVCDVLGLESA
ncbi:hypothetical protein ACYPKM_01375 [Pseudomonas aeruginosa]